MLARAAGVSRQAAHRALRHAVREGQLLREGGGRGARYVLTRQRAELTRPLQGLEEDRVLDAALAALPDLANLPANVREIFEYALTELVNNAIDHSRGKTLTLCLESSAKGVSLDVIDDGIGAFECLRRAFELETPLLALQALSKGKATSDAARHRGEEIFFVARAVDAFELEANGWCYAVDAARDDVAIAPAEPRSGTRVHVEISRNTQRRIRDVLERYAIDHAFSKTRTSVRLFSFGTRFVSRSEAKRLCAGLERFREVVLDFSGVDRVGQGFADEVFRVFASAHPETRLLVENAGEGVEYALRRALASAKSDAAKLAAPTD